MDYDGHSQRLLYAPGDKLLRWVNSGHGTPAKAQPHALFVTEGYHRIDFRSAPSWKVPGEDCRQAKECASRPNGEGIDRRQTEKLGAQQHLL